MNFRDLAAQVLMGKIEGTNRYDDATSALDSLIDGDKGFDLRDIVARFQGSGGDLASKAKSWLGDGANQSISASEVQEAIGADKVAAFASKLGIERDDANRNLAQILPELIDKSSLGGSLLDSINGKGRIAGFASRLFRKSA